MDSRTTGRFLALLLGGIASLSPLGSVAVADCVDSPCPVPPCCNGDGNGDGSIDIADAVHLLGYLFVQGPPPASIPCPSCPAPPCENGDVNGDGSIDVADGVSLLGYLFLQGAEPAAIVCGGSVDPTVTILSVNIFANCQPIVPPDPWSLQIEVTYDNSASGTAAELDIITAEIRFDPPVGPVLSVVLDPPSSGVVPAGTSSTLLHTKIGSVNDIDDCAQCGLTARVRLTLDTGSGILEVESSDLSVPCVF